MNMAFFTLFFTLFKRLLSLSFLSSSYLTNRDYARSTHFAFLLHFRLLRKKKKQRRNVLRSRARPRNITTTTGGPFTKDTTTIRLATSPREAQPSQPPPPGSENEHDRSSTRIPRHPLQQCPPEPSALDGIKWDHWKKP